MTKALDQMTAALPLFYDVFGADTIDIESPDGETVTQNVPAIFTFGEGEEYRGSDAPDTKAKVNVRVSDVTNILSGYKIYRGAEQWRVLGGAEKTSDGLEWVIPISKYT